jgi:hypothetical protein
MNNGGDLQWTWGTISEDGLGPGRDRLEMIYGGNDLYKDAQHPK